ncbi:MAG: hypothetical protein F6K40_37860, partial [Okeania sp. SIO3I5]|uniref:hypothetical protein n=1 Tax=Okeania sp. SIO3I5 TaxID=2607805 RepID=UPI0013BA6ACE
YPAPGASANETTIALYAIKEKNFAHPAPGASENETTIALYAIKEKNFIIQLRELQEMKRLLLYTQ